MVLKLKSPQAKLVGILILGQPWEEVSFNLLSWYLHSN